MENSKRTLAIGLLHVVIVLAPIALVAARPSAGAAVFAWVWTGLGMSGLLNLLHECAHLHFFKGRRANEIFGRLLGALIWADFDSYRHRHWEHHRLLGEAADPKYIYRTDIRGAGFARFALRCLSGVEAVSKFRTLGARVEKSVPGYFARVIGVQGIFFAAIWGIAFAGIRGAGSFILAAAVYALYLYTLASLTTFAAGLRAIAEHHPLPAAEARVNGAALRNFRRDPFSLAVFGAYGFSDHATHHREPGLPCGRLAEATRRLAAQEPDYAPKTSYLSTLAALVRAPRGA